jgi:Asp-tRNA(Asn)/Glu-tRNA(Gln) amidotransferase A subunit family amidase
MRETQFSSFTIENLSRLIQKREISPMEIVQSCLERIHLAQPTINAFITILQDKALHEAAQAEKEILKSWHHGTRGG